MSLDPVFPSVTLKSRLDPTTRDELELLMGQLDGALSEIVNYINNLDIPAATAPADPDKSVQWNNAGVFGGSANFTWDNAALILRVGSGGTVATSTDSAIIGIDHVVNGSAYMLIAGSNNVSTDSNYSVVGGDSNEIDNVEYAALFGSSNSLLGGPYSVVGGSGNTLDVDSDGYTALFGSNNTVTIGGYSIIGGASHGLDEVNYALVVGSGHAITGANAADYPVLAGHDHVVDTTGPVERVFLFGQQITVDDSDVAAFGLDGAAHDLSGFANLFAIFGTALLGPMAFASLPGSPVEGMIAAITDSTVATWGSTITGGGTDNVLGWFNGANWTVFAA